MNQLDVLRLRRQLDGLLLELARELEKGTSMVTIKTGRKTTELAVTILTIVGQVAGFEAGQLPATWTIAGVSVVTVAYGVGRVALKIAAVLATVRASTSAKPASTSTAPPPASATS